MRVILTGGTGFIGRALALALVERHDEVVVVSRHPKGTAVPWDAIESEVERADAVVHLAGEPVADRRWTDARLESIRTSRVDTTARVARAIQRATRKPRVFVSGSAVGYYGMHRDDRVLDESSPPGDDVLARICVAWEAAADPARIVTRVVHPRTGVVLERSGGALAKMVPAFEMFVGGPVGSGTQWLGWIHLRDQVRALLFAIDHEALTGAFNVTAPEPVDMNHFAKALGHALHRPSAMRVPATALKLALGTGLAEVLLTGQRAIPRNLQAAGFTFNYPTIGPALSAIFAPA
jgi:uncharacterized protein (TIGR01777 family)